MAGTKSTRAVPDKAASYRRACALLAQTLGYSFEEVWHHWQYLWSLHEYARCLPRDAAQERAWLDVQTMLDKRGKTDPS